MIHQFGILGQESAAQRAFIRADNQPVATTEGQIGLPDYPGEIVFDEERFLIIIQSFDGVPNISNQTTAGCVLPLSFRRQSLVGLFGVSRCIAMADSNHWVIRELFFTAEAIHTSPRIRATW